MQGIQPFDPVTLVWIAVLNPAVIITGFLMGRAADQWQKLVVAAFVAAIAGAVMIWLAAFVRVLPVRGVGGEAGLFVMQFVLGFGWALAGYMTRRRSA